MDMTPTERRLFEEAVIKKYKLKHEAKNKDPPYVVFMKRMKKIAPVNIIIGIAACIGVIYIRGWSMFIYIILSAIIWLTLISTVLAAVFKPE